MLKTLALLALSIPALAIKEPPSTGQPVPQWQGPGLPVGDAR